MPDGTAAADRRIRAVWRRIERWLKAHLPEMKKDLNAGATDRRITIWERKTSCRFPAELRAFYRVHDGQASLINTGLFFGLEFMSLKAMHLRWKQWAELLEGDREGMQEIAKDCSRSARPGLVREDYANKSWIPFAFDWGGNFLGVDLDPGPKGKTGQVINFGRDENTKYVLAESFGDFADWLVTEYEGGNFAIRIEDDGGRSLNTKRPNTSHFLDSVPKMFAVKKR